MTGYLYILYTVLFCAALWLLFRYAPRGVSRTVCVFVCIGLIYFLICEFLIVKDSREDGHPERDYVIVLGAGVRGYEPSLSLVHRLQAVYEYLVTYPDSKAVLSGGKGPGEFISEAQCMFDWLTENGITPDRLIMEDKSTSTMENLTFSKALISSNGGDGVNVAVVSSPYHLCRAKYMARSIGLNPCGVPGSPGYPVYSLGMYIREAFGLTHLWVFGD